MCCWEASNQIIISIVGNSLRKKVRREVKFQAIKNAKYYNSLYLALNSSWTCRLKVDFSSKLEEVDDRVLLDPVYKNYCVNIGILPRSYRR